MAQKKDFNYFELFVGGVSYAAKVAGMLQGDFADYRPEKLPLHIEELHKIEHAADIAKHDGMECLLKEFITPIDREDIMDLANTIDDVTDSVEDVLMRLYMFNITSLREEAATFADIIASCCAAMETMMQEFRKFRKSKTIRAMIIEIHRLEEEGDKLYTEAMHRLYSNPPDAVETLAWTNIFDRLEKCCDNCEDVADVVERVILKNS